MPIDLVWGEGSGQTELGAFDNALESGQIHNYNLVELSSVVPEGARINYTDSLEPNRWTVGDLLAVVLASDSSTVEGEKIVAGLGWAMAEEGGIFMENHASTIDACENKLKRNIEDAKSTRNWNWEPGYETKVVDHVVQKAGAVVVASVFHPISDGVSVDDR